MDNCQAASLLFGGDKSCDYGCLGLGSCVRVCPFDAITVNQRRAGGGGQREVPLLPEMRQGLPPKLISMVPKNQTVLVACKNLDKGKKAKEVCSIACIACRICEKNLPRPGHHRSQQPRRDRLREMHALRHLRPEVPAEVDYPPARRADRGSSHGRTKVSAVA